MVDARVSLSKALLQHFTPTELLRWWREDGVINQDALPEIKGAVAAEWFQEAVDALHRHYGLVPDKFWVSFEKARPNVDTTKIRTEYDRLREELPPSFGTWRPIRRIGSGGMGTVYEVESPSHGRAALKILNHPESDDSAERARLFRRGAMALKHLTERTRHPALVEYLDGDLECHPPWYVITLIERAATLHDYGPKILTRSLDERLAAFEHLADVVSLAHRQRIYHRDLTPNNVLVSVKDGTLALTLVDFDRARDLDHLNVSKTVFNPPPHYTPPSVPQDGRRFLGRPAENLWDLGGLGIVLHFLLTGSYDHNRVSRAEQRQQALNDARSGVVLDDFARRLLTDDPVALPRNADEVKKWIAHARSVEAGEAQPHNPFWQVDSRLREYFMQGMKSVLSLYEPGPVSDLVRRLEDELTARFYSIERDLYEASNRTLRIRHPQIRGDTFRILLDLGRASNSGLRIVSWDDLDFWATATTTERRDPTSIPQQYRAALAAFEGPKERVLVLRHCDIVLHRDRLMRTVDAMIDDGFRIRLLRFEDYLGRDDPDFCLVGEVASYMFQTKEESRPDERELIVWLGAEAISSDIDRWTRTIGFCEQARERAWDSRTGQPIEEFLSDASASPPKAPTE